MADTEAEKMPLQVKLDEFSEQLSKVCCYKIVFKEVKIFIKPILDILGTLFWLQVSVSNISKKNHLKSATLVSHINILLRPLKLNCSMTFNLISLL